MTNSLRTAVAGMFTTLRAAAGETILYRRGGQSVELPAVTADVAYEQQDSEGFTQVFHSRDFLVEAAGLLLDGETVLPQEHDRIRQLHEDNFYEVMGPGDGPCFQFSDPYEQQFRIHTKRIEKA